MMTEYNLVISYLNLYRATSAESECPPRKETIQTDHLDQNNVQHNQLQKQHSIWDEYEWTEGDDMEAQRLLAQSLDKCRIHSRTSDINNVKNNYSEQLPTTVVEVPSDNDAWDSFYSHHRTNFFKDRHYLDTAFPEEFAPSPVKVTATSLTESGETEKAATGRIEERTLVEIGCGVGNALLPLLEQEEENDKNNNSNGYMNRIRWNVIGLDLSSVAIDLLKKDERFQRAQKASAVSSTTGIKAQAFVANIVEGIPDACHHVADVASLVFCLSAVDPDYHLQAIQNAVATLRSEKDGGGTIIFRDYGRFDESQLKLGRQRNKLLKENYYVKHDATKCYFFTTDELRDLFERQAGLEVLELDYVRRIYYNHGSQSSRKRVWVQGRFRIPSLSSPSSLLK